jgi:hypothetical protein
MVMLMGIKCCKVHKVVWTYIIVEGVKDILVWDIFDTFFRLIKVYLFIRGPPYQFKKIKLIRREKNE